MVKSGLNEPLLNVEENVSTSAPVFKTFIQEKTFIGPEKTGTTSNFEIHYPGCTQRDAQVTWTPENATVS